VSNLGESAIEFSGAASLVFDDTSEMFLTWSPSGDYHLITAQLSDWSNSLDLIHASGEDPWGLLIGMRLAQVALLKDAAHPGEIIAVRHAFNASGASLDLWIGVGRGRRMQEADDLVVCVGAPENIDELELVETFE
jgi:hypothetical protein